ncbi:MAG TPA: translocation/assembly module TamB, partial [Allosphingosinicella sp.]|nr:translocation/assembly module TamB [Allosphingosinicella sp.]
MDEAEALSPPRRPSRLSRLAKLVVGIALALALAAAALAVLLDTGPGHRFIADRIAAMAPDSGLKIRIGRIEGSIWSDTKLRDVRLSDPQGLFAESPLIEVDWQPLGWIANRLVIHRLDADLATLHRLPKLRPSERPGPVLPGFDIHVGRLRVEQLRIGEAVSGRARVASLAGEADIRSGRALVDLRARVRDGGDRLTLLLDAEPDRDRFDLDIRLDSPARGVAGAMLGTGRPIALVVEGDGRWAAWNGRLAPAQFWRGKKARLTAPLVQVSGEATLEDRRLDGRLTLRSPAMAVAAAGTIDLARSGFRDLRVGADLLRPPALFPNMTGQKVRLVALLNGPFRTFAFAYRLTSPRIAFDNTGFEDVWAQGRGRFSKTPVTVPLVLSARRVTGVGDVAGGI